RWSHQYRGSDADALGQFAGAVGLLCRMTWSRWAPLNGCVGGVAITMPRPSPSPSRRGISSRLTHDVVAAISSVVAGLPSCRSSGDADAEATAADPDPFTALQLCTEPHPYNLVCKCSNLAFHIRVAPRNLNTYYSCNAKGFYGPRHLFDAQKHRDVDPLRTIPVSPQWQLGNAEITQTSFHSAWILCSADVAVAGSEVRN
ncbi:hypothetical protein E2562_025098, partial [Oryza meyeriana var. granulata]